MQARTILPDPFKAPARLEPETPRAEKKSDNAFLSLVMERSQAQAIESSQAAVPPAQPAQAEPEKRNDAAERVAESARKAESAEQAVRAESDREIKDKDKSETETSKAEKQRENPETKPREQAAALEHAAAAQGREPQRRPERREDLHRPLAARLQAAFDLRPVDRSSSAGLDALVNKVINRERALSHARPEAPRPEKHAQTEKAAPEVMRSFAENPRTVKEQTKRPEEQIRLAAERNLETAREPAKKSEVKEKSVVISVNPEKWTVEHEKRDFKEFRGGSQGERREVVRDLREIRDSKAPRERAQPELREAAFNELLKSPAPAELKRAPAETREAFSKLVERARINVGADGTSTASMRLKPEQLGSVTLNLRVAGSQVEAKLVVESELVKKMMKEEIEQLAVELKRQGFSVDAIEIRVREPSEQGSLSFTPDQNSKNADPRSGTGTIIPAVPPRGDTFEYGELPERPLHEGAVNLAV